MPVSPTETTRIRGVHGRLNSDKSLTFVLSRPVTEAIIRVEGAEDRGPTRMSTMPNW